MQNQRMIMGGSKKQEDLKNIKATMTVGNIDGNSSHWYGFEQTTRIYGSLTPNPLKNNILITQCCVNKARTSYFMYLTADCTINNIRYYKNNLPDKAGMKALYDYLYSKYKQNIPVIFHF